MCSNPYESANMANSCDAYWGPLSLLTISGIRCREKAAFIATISALEVVDTNFTTSGNRNNPPPGESGFLSAQTNLSQPSARGTQAGVPRSGSFTGHLALLQM